MTLRICFLSEILFLFTADDTITLYHQLSRYCIILKHLSSVFEVHSSRRHLYTLRGRGFQRKTYIFLCETKFDVCVFKTFSLTLKFLHLKYSFLFFITLFSLHLILGRQFQP